MSEIHSLGTYVCTNPQCGTEDPHVHQHWILGWDTPWPPAPARLCNPGDTP